MTKKDIMKIKISVTMITRSIKSSSQALLITILLLLGQTMSAYGQFTADAGPDTSICKGSCVTLGGQADPSFCFHWSPAAGLSADNVPNPTACPEVTTTYTLTVTAPDFSWTSTSQVVVTVIVISDITFSLTPLPNTVGLSSQGLATTTSGGPLLWSFKDGNIPGLSITSSGLITVTSSSAQSGNVIVVVKDSLNPDCEKEGTLCIGTGDDCCKAYEDNTIKTFGPVSVTVDGDIESLGAATGGYCSYQCPAGVTISMEGVFQKTYTIPGVTVGWEENPSDPSDFKNVSITWNGEHTAGTFGVIDANILQLSLTINEYGDLGGSVTFGAYLNQDKNLGSIAVLRSGLGGSFTYTYTPPTPGGGSFMSSGGFSGAWNFNGITGFQVDLVKNNSVIASVTVGSFDGEGNINNAVLSAATPAIWTTNNFNASLEVCSLAFNYSIPENEVEFLGGTAQVKITNIPKMDGYITLALTFDANTVTASASLSDIKAFNCTLSGTLTAEIDYDFNLNKIAGSGISAKHNEFEQSFTNIEFEISDGALEKFSMGALQAKFKNKITFSMTNASYEKATGLLKFNAKVVLPALQLTVTDFKIDENGSTTVGNIKTEINSSPITASINIGWSSDEFSGNFAGQFANKIAVQGSVTIGATATFNYGHFSLSLSGFNVALGASGITVYKIAGEFGYNWQAPTGDNGSGTPQQGSVTIGFGLGLSDVASIVGIYGYIQFTLGASTQINLIGSVSITANAPHYFLGQVNIYYSPGTEKITGSMSSEIKFPPATGNVIKFNTGNVTFEIGGNKWSVESGTIPGTLFDVMTATASLKASAFLNSPANITGNLTGTLNWDYQWMYVYPAGFDPTDCNTAYNTSSASGFGIHTSLNLNFGGNINATVNQNGITGSFSTQIGATATLIMRWPSWLQWGANCVDSYNASVEGSLLVQKTTNGARINGTAYFKYNGEVQEGEIDLYI